MPFEDWYDALRDKHLERAVDARLARIADGTFGDHKSVGEGAGLRIYSGLSAEEIAVLIAGGDKGSQQKAIQTAKPLWAQYQRENKRF